MEGICFFIGHGDAGDELKEELNQVIEELIQTGAVKSFFVGKYGSFDQMAAHAVIEAKKRHNEVSLNMVTPYHPAERSIYKPNEFDEIFYPFETAVPPRYAIVRANQKMIDRSDYVIAYVRRPGKARDFLEYAQRAERMGKLRIKRI